MTFKNVQGNEFSSIKDYSSFKNDQDTCTNKISVVLGNILRYSTHDTHFFWDLIILWDTEEYSVEDLFYTKNLPFDNHSLDRSQS